MDTNMLRVEELIKDVNAYADGVEQAITDIRSIDPESRQLKDLKVSYKRLFAAIEIVDELLVDEIGK